MDARCPALLLFALAALVGALPAAARTPPPTNAAPPHQRRRHCVPKRYNC
jgi:hypothetical protein